MTSYIKQFKQINPNLILVSISILVWGIAEGSFMIFQPIYLQELGASPVLIGLIIGLNGLSMALLPIPVGILTDKIGPRPIMLFSWFFAAFAAWIMALANSLPVFIIGLLLYGLTFSMLAPLNIYVVNARGKLSTTRALSLITISYNLGAIIGPVLGGWIGQKTNLKTVYLVAASIIILSTLIILFISKQDPVTTKTQSKTKFDFLKNRIIITFLLLIAISTLTTYLPWPLTPNFLQNIKGLSLTQIGQLGSIGSMGNVLIMLLLANMRPYYGWLFGQLFVSLFAAAIWLGTGFGWYGFGFLIFGGYRLIHIMYLAFAKPMINPQEIGFFYGLIEAVNAAAIFLAPPIAGYLYNRNPETIYPVSIFLILFTLGICSIFLKKISNSFQDQI
ncbi:MAG: MFS transporter [Anaerolineaceae bacterium]|nr:MFS transporter [Anaerolineaceae bacterium]